jgi:Polyketide cyclase / dehydrase and lipid transport
MQATTLRNALLSNALFSVLSGSTFIGFSRPVADLIGLGEPIWYQIIGFGLLAFASIVAWVAMQKPINTLLAALISIADFLWVAGTILLVVLTLGTLQAVGILVLLGIAAMVLFFGLRQLHGIGLVYAVANKPNTHRLCVAVDTPTTPDKIWAIIADLSSIHLYSPNLAKVILRDDAKSGVGAVRQCTDTNGKMWGEHCKVYDDQARQTAFQFLSDAPNFPYPFKAMWGGWEVEAKGAGATVNIWFEVTPKNRLTHPIILAFMANGLANGFGEIVARMTAAARGDAVPIKVSLGQQGIKSALTACL